jgi:hypothetical protein
MAALLGVVVLAHWKSFESIMVVAFVVVLVGSLLVVRALFRRATRPAIELSVLDLAFAAAWRWRERRRRTGPRVP